MNPFAKDSAPKNHLDEDKSMPQKEEEVKKVKEVIPSEPVNVVKSQKQKILDSHGGLESNVPINSKYWKLRG